MYDVLGAPKKKRSNFRPGIMGTNLSESGTEKGVRQQPVELFRCDQDPAQPLRPTTSRHAALPTLLHPIPNFASICIPAGFPRSFSFTEYYTSPQAQS